MLIASGRGTGPTTPRQPVEALLQCPGANSSPKRSVSGKDEKSACLGNLFSSDEKGFFIGPGKEKYMQNSFGFMKALKCRECGREYPLRATHVCEFDFGPLEVVYDYERIKKTLTREAIQGRAKGMWRYRELLPIAGAPTVGTQVGVTPLVKADRLGKRLGVCGLGIQND